MITVTPETSYKIVHRSQNTLFCEHGNGGVCRDENGVLYAVASGMRMQQIDPFGTLCMYVSRDGGAKWSPSVVIRESYTDDRDPAILYLGDGKLMVTWITLPATLYMGSMYQSIKNATDRNTAGPVMGMLASYPYLPREQMEGGSYYMISDDYGVTWSEPCKMPIVSPFGPMLCANGALLWMGEECFSGDAELKGHLAVYLSVDKGQNWEQVSILPLAEEQILSDPCIVELPNNRLFATVHAHAGSTNEDGKVVYHGHTLYTTYSDDYGKTWSDWRCLHVSGAPGHLLLHSTGALICTYDRWVAPATLQALVSYDNGFSWEEEYLLAERADTQHGTPVTVEMEDGSLLTVFKAKCDGDNYSSVLAATWKLNPRPEPEIVEPEAEPEAGEIEAEPVAEVEAEAEVEVEAEVEAEAEAEVEAQEQTE